MTEREVLDAYSTPGLRKSELSRHAKRLHLGNIGVRDRDDVDEILSSLYPDSSNGV